MKVIGTDKIGFIECEKHGTVSLNKLVTDYEFITKWSSDGDEEHYPSEKIILFPWRDEFESVKSGFLQDISTGLIQLLAADVRIPESFGDENLLAIFRHLFNKKNNTNILLVEHHHKRLLLDWDFFPYFFRDNREEQEKVKFYDFDLKDLSNPKLIEWISEHDPRWKDVSIEHDHISVEDPMKMKIKDILVQIKDELGDDYLDYEDINNWPTFRYYYQFSKMFYESRKELRSFF